MTKGYFSKGELKCSHCGEYFFNKNTLLRLNGVREEFGKPMLVTSGYRCKEYNSLRGFTQTHATGQAVDISCSRKDAFKLLKIALNFGFTGIGIKQKGEGRFIHLDDLATNEERIRPTIWSY
jgi:uncharacterized protein YcbK (DUF882 family)